MHLNTPCLFYSKQLSSGNQEVHWNGITANSSLHDLSTFTYYMENE